MKKLFYSMMAVAIALCTFNSCEDVPEPYNNPYNQAIISSVTSIEPAGTGTAEDPFNVAAALEKCSEVGETGTTEDVYAVGYVVSIAEVSAQYGNATFNIADSPEGGDALTVYRAKGPGNQNITDENLLKNGDKVVICGKLVNYKGNTPEFTQGCYIVSINGAGGSSEEKKDDEVIGSKEAPKTVADALAAISALESGKTTTAFYYVKGKVKTVKTTDENITTYKNIDYIIVDEGQDNELTVFRGKYLDGADFTVENKVKAGDVVIVYGKLKKYEKDGVITPEFDQGNYLVSLNSEGGTTPTPTPTGDNLLTNGDFETWSDGTPDNWKSTTTASKATLSQSTDAHTGTYAVLVNHDANDNKRLAYKEITLKAGTYYVQFYVKAADAAGASVNPGYTPVTNGKAGSYQYNGYVNDITTSWQEVSYNFTLAAQSTINLVVMVPKNSGTDVIIDDYVLSTADGGIVEGEGETGNEGDDETSGTSFSKVTTIDTGTYIFAANTEGTSYAVAGPIAADKTYGYLPKVDASASGDAIKTDEANAFTFTAVEGGYTIQDASGRYYFMKGTYNSFNVAAEAPSEGHVWTISFDNGNVVIKNVLTEKTIQYSSQYGSYGAYADVTNTLPALFKK